MTDEELIEAVAKVIADGFGEGDRVSHIARAVIPVAQAPLLARIAELEQLVIQYRDDLKYPPADDSRERRIEAINRALRSTQ